MVPQQQQQQQPQQPYYSSFPATSDSSLHPPGTDPVANSTPSSVYYAHSQADYQNWILQQPQSVAYFSADGASQETSAVSASLPPEWNATWPHQTHGNETTTVLPNQSKAVKGLRCEVCKIDVNSQDAYEKHIAGKKHKKNSQAVGASQETSAASASLPPEWNATWPHQPHDNETTTVLPNQSKVVKGLRCEVCKIDVNSQDVYEKHIAGKKHKKNSQVCEICNVLCNSEDSYNQHIKGRKHTSQVALMSNNGIGPTITEFKRNGIGPWQKPTKKIKVAQSSWCEVCKINCNSSDMYIVHLAGKKHLKNLEKLSNPKGEVATSTTATSTASKALIGPQEKPDTDKPNKASEVDIETKKRKVAEAGAKVDGIKMCTLCNVECNSQTVFDTHIVGQKHVAKMKKAGSSTG